MKAQSFGKMMNIMKGGFNIDDIVDDPELLAAYKYAKEQCNNKNAASNLQNEFKSAGLDLSSLRQQFGI